MSEQTAQEKCDDWNREHGFEVAKAGPRVVHQGFNRKRRRNGDAERFIEEMEKKHAQMRGLAKE